MREHVLALLNKYLPGPFRPSGGSNVLTRCPFHKGGQERKPSFSVNVDLGVYHCFTCHEAGNIRHLLQGLGVARSIVDREVSSIEPILQANKERRRFEKANVFKKSDPFEADYVLPEELLAAYEFMPLNLAEAGFDPAILQFMEVGFDRHNQRVTYPLRDMYGSLAGISGGAVRKDQWPKYKVYQGGRLDINGRWAVGDFGSGFDDMFPDYVCENHDFLWNYNRVWSYLQTSGVRIDRLYVVEGFKACLWMVQHGYYNTVALMGSYISDRQQQLLHRFGGRITLFLDNDAPGKKATVKVADFLFDQMYGRIDVINYPNEDKDTQPDDYPQEQLHVMVQNPTTFIDYFNTKRREGTLL